MPVTRLDHHLRAVADENVGQTVPERQECLARIQLFAAPSLPLLLALFSRPMDTFTQKRMSLLVIESLTALFNTAYPKHIAPKNGPNDPSHWAAGRKFAVQSHVIDMIIKLAAQKDVAVLLTSQSSTRMRTDSNSIITPALSTASWVGGLSNRLVLYSDWSQSQIAPPAEDAIECISHIGILKIRGTNVTDGSGFDKHVRIKVEKVRVASERQRFHI